VVVIFVIQLAKEWQRELQVEDGLASALKLPLLARLNQRPRSGWPSPDSSSTSHPMSGLANNLIEKISGSGFNVPLMQAYLDP
jgi:hypothetical protein